MERRGDQPQPTFPEPGHDAPSHEDAVLSGVELLLGTCELSAWEIADRSWLAGELPGALLLIEALDPSPRELLREHLEALEVQLQTLPKILASSAEEISELDAEATETLAKELGAFTAVARCALERRIPTHPDPETLSSRTRALAASVSLGLDDALSAIRWLGALDASPEELDEMLQTRVGVLRAHLAALTHVPAPSLSDAAELPTHASMLSALLARAQQPALSARFAAASSLDVRLDLILQQALSAGAAAEDPRVIATHRERIARIERFLSTGLRGEDDSEEVIAAAGAALLSTLVQEDVLGGVRRDSERIGLAPEITRALDTLGRHDPLEAAVSARSLLQRARERGVPLGSQQVLAAACCERYWLAGLEAEALTLAGSTGLLSEELLATPPEEDVLVALTSALGMLLVARSARSELSPALLAAHAQLHATLEVAAPTPRMLREVTSMLAALLEMSEDPLQQPYALETLQRSITYLAAAGQPGRVMELIVEAAPGRSEEVATEIVTILARCAETLWNAGRDAAAHHAYTLGAQGLAPEITEHLEEAEAWKTAAEDSSVPAVLELALARVQLDPPPSPAEVTAVIHGVLGASTAAWTGSSGRGTESIALLLEVISHVPAELLAEAPRGLGQRVCLLARENLPDAAARALPPDASAGLCSAITLARRDRHVHEAAGAAARVLDTAHLLPGRLTGIPAHLDVHEAAWRGVLETILLGPHIPAGVDSPRQQDTELGHLTLGAELGLASSLWGNGQLRTQIAGELAPALIERLEAALISADPQSALGSAAVRAQNELRELLTAPDVGRRGATSPEV